METNHNLDVEAARAICRDLRAAARANLDAAVCAARSAEQQAAAHRQQMEHLAASVAAMDAALSTVTAPTTLND